MPRFLLPGLATGWFFLAFSGLWTLPLVPAAAQTVASAGLPPFWQWQDPHPTGSTLHDLATFNDSVALVTGNQGVLLRTSNRGRTWQVRNSGTPTDIQRLSFANAQVGWMTYTLPPPRRAQVRRTVDGGQTWTVQNVGLINANAVMLDVAALSPTAAYVMLHVQGIIFSYSTTDGGLTWNYVAQNLPPGTYDGARLQFFSPTLGYLKLQPASSFVPSALFKTTDGGTTWREVSPPGTEVGETCFVSALVGWALVDGAAANCYGTTDGGATWQPRTVTNGSPPRYGVHYLAFADALHGVATSGVNDVFTTSNGGVSWQLTPYVVGPALTLRRVQLRPSGAGWMVGDGGWVAHTTDFGATWTPGTQTLTTPGYYGFTKMQAFEPGYAWAFVPGNTAQGATLAQTTRRGEPWRARAVSPPAGTAWSSANYFAMHFADRDTGFVHVVALNTGSTSYGHYVLRTADAGSTWASSGPLPVSPLLDASGLAFYQATRGLLFGERGRLWLTTDGGRTWQPRPSGTSHALRAATWVDARTVLAIGDSAAAVKSTDGGLTWQPMLALSALLDPDQPRLYAMDNAISVVSPQIAFVVSGGSSCYRTADGGTTWTRVFLLPVNGDGISVSSASFDSPTTGRALALGANGNYVFNTTDAGATWSLSTKLTNGRDALIFLALTDRYNGYAAGGGLVRYSEKYLQTDTAANQRRSYCAGEELAVGVTVTGSLSANPADYRVQLSNRHGRFRPGELRILSPAPGSTLATLRATLPAALPPSTRYRVRVVLADNTVLGGDNQRDLTINALVTASIVPAGPALSLCQGSTLQLTAPAGLAQYQWSTGATTRTIIVATAGTYTVQVAAVTGCLGPAAAPVTVSGVPVPLAPVIQQSAAGQLSVGTPLPGATYQWALDGRPLPGATLPTYPAAGAAPVGTYTVVATVGGCASPPSQGIAVVLATKAPAPLGLMLYPNPARTAVAVAGLRAGDLVEVLDLLGRAVAHDTADARGTAQLVLPAGLAAGVYGVRSGTQVQRLTVE